MTNNPTLQEVEDAKEYIETCGAHDYFGRNNAEKTIGQALTILKWLLEQEDDGDMPEIVISELGGQCPVQAEGFINDKPFYFRSRGGGWSLSVGGEDVVGNPDWDVWVPYEDPNPSEHPIAGEMHFAAGWIDESTAKSFIHIGALLYINRPSAILERK